MRRAAIAALAIALGGCPRFHADALPGAPADATFVDVAGVHVRYRDVGSGPAVVMIHGFGASSDSWLPVLPAASKHHRVIAIDLKGFGWTSRPEGDYSPTAQAALVWHVLDQLGVPEAALVGHSWGSSVVLAMAAQQPKRVKRIALYDAYVYDDQVPSFFRWAQKAGIGEALFGLYYTERIEDRAPLAYYDERWITQARVDRVEADLAKPGTVAAALAAVRGHHFAALHRALATADLHAPVLLLWGENDEVTPLRFGQRLANELRDARLVVYPRCGHIPMVEAAGQSTRDLTMFLDEDRNTPAPTPESPTPTPTPTPAGGAADDGDHDLTTIVIPNAPAVEREAALPIGADLASLGAELTPRLYAAPRDKVELVIHGGLRVRTGQLYNLDLDRGLDSRGKPLFQLPLGGGQTLAFGDVRARTDVAAYAPGVGVAVKARIDWLDNVALGSDPDLSNGSPATTTGQGPSAAVVKRAWGEVLLPFGTLAAGRMGAHLGLGIVANGGDCEDCDHGDANDRLALISPVAGHLIALAYDVDARGPYTRSRDGGRAIGLEPSDRVGGETAALLKVHSPAALARRAAAGLVTTEYAAYVTHRAQDTDVPASYLPTAAPRTGFAPADLVARGFTATGTGGWLRITSEGFRIEAELAYLHANLAHPSLVPGADITIPVTSSQLGFAFESDFVAGPSKLGFDGGYASGDSAPGFGARPAIGDTATTAGAFDGPQADLPRDHTVDNFRFHPDYHVDQILFREIIGTITDAIYLRPHARATLLEVGAGRLEIGGALIASWAVEPTSTPSGARMLGVELDPEIRYASRDGFALTIDYGLLFPGAAFDNPDANRSAKPAQTIRGRLGFVF